MKSNVKLMIGLCSALCPLFSWAAPPATCLQAYHNQYALTANGHTGSLVRTQAAQPDSTSYSIESIVTVHAFFATHRVTQQAQGTYQNFTITPLRYATDKAGQGMTAMTLAHGTIDSVSLPLVLACALNAGEGTKILGQSLSVLHQNNIITVQCQRRNINTAVSIGPTAVAATQMCCATADNTLEMCYFFSQDGQYTLLSATEADQGVPTFSAILTATSG